MKEFLHVCETALFDDKGRLSTINIFDNINTDSLPAVHAKFSIAVRIPSDTNAKEIKLEIATPSDTVIAVKEKKIKNKENTFIFRFINVVFNEYGTNSIKLYINDKEYKEYFLKLTKQNETM